MSRKQQLFDSAQRAASTDLVSPTVRYKLDKKKGQYEPLSPVDKMKCALRKAITDWSNADENKCRFYIDGEIKLMQQPTFSEGPEGEARNYYAAGLCHAGVCHPEGHKSSKLIQFDINFRDSKDELGQPDVEYFTPTTIDELPKSHPLNY